MRYQCGMAARVVAAMAMAAATSCTDYSYLDMTECPRPIPDACGAVCVNLDTDANNCGACGEVCSVTDHAASVVCAGGECVVSECAQGRADCDGRADNGCEVDLQTSALHCGTCETACATTCLSGACDDPIFVSAGPTYTCAIRASGSVWCWGDNTWGNLGVGDKEPRKVPEKVELGKPAKSVATGRFAERMHTCALLADDTVACWGANGNGQLGTGDVIPSESPVHADLPADTVAVAVAVGGRHTCALTATHEVWCWGANEDGQVGTGMSNDPHYTPAHISSNAASIALGAQHTCAGNQSGSVLCWGANTNGQIGNGTNNPVYLPNVTFGLVGTSTVAAGAASSCTLVENGGVACWGANNAGQLGTGTIGDETKPVLLPGMKGALSLHLGLQSSAVIRPDGVWAWGANDAGQLGTGDTKPTLAPVLAKKLGKVKQLSLGGGHGCAILESGALACWGANDAGQLGTGDTAPQLTPTVVSFSSEAP